MAEIKTKRHTAPRRKGGAVKTGDPILDLWVYCWRDAFDLAANGDEQSKAELVAYFGIPLLFNLYRRRVIHWDPLTVTMQPMLEVM